eukprot:3180157-Alexandrium_andersonii.AAC.1
MIAEGRLAWMRRRLPGSESTLVTCLGSGRHAGGAPADFTAVGRALDERLLPLLPPTETEEERGRAPSVGTGWLAGGPFASGGGACGRALPPAVWSQ